jgi:hypothetical protein
LTILQETGNLYEPNTAKRNSAMEPSSIIVIVLVFGFIAFYWFYLRHKLEAGGDTSTPVGGAEAKHLRKMLKGADMSRFTAKLKGMREGAWDDRDFWLDIVAPSALEPVMDAWIAGGNELALGHLIKGRAHIAWAWEARGSGTADAVTDDGANLFEQHLRKAEADLLAAAELDPADPTPWAYLITVARGLGHGADVARDRYDQAVRRDPAHWTAHFQMLLLLCAKWGGSHDSMFAFAREAASRMPEGHDLGALVIMAHIERWLYFSFDDDTQGEKQYLKNAEAARECLTAYQRSVGSPQAHLRRSTIHARNIAAFWFFLTRDKANLRAEVDHIGNDYTTLPWGYWNDPEQAYSAAAQLAHR